MKKQAKKRKIIAAVIVVLILVAIAVFADALAPNDPYATNAAYIRKPPTVGYWFGTDNLGRCVFSRVLVGAKTTIASTFFLVGVSFILGTVIGMLCGYYGGIVDDILMRLADLMLAFPQMVVAIAVAGILGGGLKGAMIALGITAWTSFARLARSHTKSIKDEPYIIVAKLSGKNGAYIMLRHILPNIVEPVFINALTQVGTTMIGISGLSFLGLGVVAPQAEWGSMISEARAYIQIAPWAVLFPAAATIITIIAFNYLGDAVVEYKNAD